ncbi:hypothetical protein STEG23_032365, partial [Scotinomys teguina]
VGTVKANLSLSFSCKGDESEDDIKVLLLHLIHLRQSLTKLAEEWSFCLFWQQCWSYRSVSKTILKKYRDKCSCHHLIKEASVIENHIGHVVKISGS